MERHWFDVGAGLGMVLIIWLAFTASSMATLTLVL